MLKLLKGIFWLTILEAYMLLVMAIGMLITFIFYVTEVILLSNIWTIILGVLLYWIYLKV